MTVADPGETVTVSGTATGFTTINPATLTIDDSADTAPTAITLSATPTSVAEGVTQTVTVTATLSPTDITLPGATEVTVSVAAGTAQAADFGTVTNFMITIPAGATSGEGTFPFAVTEDTVADPGETVTVSGTATGFITINPATLTIDDDADTAPTAITLSATPTSVAEGVTQTVTVTATLSPTDITLPGATEVTVSVAAGTAQAADFTAVSDFTVTIDAGETSGTADFSLVVTEDTIADPDETVTVSGTATGFTTINPATLTIDDSADTAPTAITLSATPTSVAEGVTQTVTVTATLSPTDITLPGATEVTVSVAAGTAQAADFGTVTSFMVTIAAGATSGEGTFEFVVTDDEVADPGETVTVSGTATGFTTINPATLTIDDSADTAPTAITLSATPTSVAEGVTQTVTVTATLSPTDITLPGATEVTVSVAAGTAQAADFGTVTSFMVTIAAGATSGEGTFEFVVTDDEVADPGETVTVSGTATGFTTINPATLTIDDDADTAPTAITLSATPTSVAEGVTQTVTVTATLSPTDITLPGATEVTVSVAAGTAQAADFGTVTNFMITIAAGATRGEGTFEFVVTDDEVADPGETVTVSGTATGFTTINPATLTIDDSADTAPTAITLSATPTSVAEGVTQTVTVTATLSPTDITLPGATEVTVSVAAGTAQAADFGTVTNFMITIPAGATSGEGTFPFAVTEDTVADPGETVTVSGTATGFITINPATLTIDDDADTAPTAITLSATPTSVAEGVTQTVTVTATLSPTDITLPGATEVTVSVAAGTAQAADFTAVSDFTVTIDAGETSGTADFSLVVTEDTIADPDETVTVSGTATDFTITSATLTIDDNDTAPTEITLSATPTSVAEGVTQTVTVTATLSPTDITLPGATEVTVSVAAGTAQAADFGTVTNFMITIPAGATSGEGTFPFAVTEDTVADPGETVTVSGTATGFITINPATLTIDDDADTAPTAITLSATPTSVAEGVTQTVTVTATLSPTDITLPGATEVTVSVAAGHGAGGGLHRGQ